MHPFEEYCPNQSVMAGLELTFPLHLRAYIQLLHLGRRYSWLDILFRHQTWDISNERPRHQICERWPHNVQIIHDCLNWLFIRPTSLSPAIGFFIPLITQTNKWTPTIVFKCMWLRTSWRVLNLNNFCALRVVDIPAVIQRLGTRNLRETKP